MILLKFFFFWIFCQCFASGVHHHPFACVKNCRCNRQKQMIHCSNEELTRVVKFSPSAKTLIMDDNQLESIDFDRALNDTLDRFSLVELSLRRNNITSAMLKSNSFERFVELKFLHLDGNRLTYLADGLLSNNPHLERLTLSDNPLLIHDSSAMAAFQSSSLASSLKHIDISRTLTVEHLGELPAFLSNLTSLEELILQNSYFKNTTNDAFAHLRLLPNFKHLDLSESTIEFINGSCFSHLKNIVELDLSGANISSEAIASIFRGLNNSQIEILKVDRIFVGNNTGVGTTHDLFHQINASKLRFLDMDGNFMAFRGRLPEKLLHSLRHLSDLFLESCNLISIPTNAFQGLHLLKRLSLRNNLLSCVRGSECFFLQGAPLKHLRHLDLSNNRLSDTESSVTFKKSVFPSLEFLDLKSNNLVAISIDMFDALPKLVQLDLNNNPIEEIEQNSFRLLSLLTTLNLEGCKHLIRLKHGALNGLSSLRVLNLRDSGLTHIHHTAFGHLSHLEELYLRGNKFAESRDQLLNVTIFKPALKILDIGENGLENLPEGLIAKSYEMITLYADGNRLRDCRELAVFGALNTLETLDLSHNHLADVSKECFEIFHNIKSIDLSGNPFACTCPMYETIQWLSDSGLVDTNHHGYRCASPLSKINENIFHLQPGSECQEFGSILLVSSLMTSLIVVFILAGALWYSLKKRGTGSCTHKIPQNHARPRMESSSSFYSPLDEEDACKPSVVFESCGRQSIDRYNDECHYFDNDHQQQALVDKEDGDETRIFKGRTTNGLFGKYKRVRSKKPYANISNVNKARSPNDQEASCSFGKANDNDSQCHKISGLDTVDRKTLMLEVTSTNSPDCDIHLEDSVL